MVVRTMTINCDRIKQVAFSTAYFEAGQQLLVPKGSPITGFDDSLQRQDGVHGDRFDRPRPSCSRARTAPR